MIQIERTFHVAAPPADVWRALTDVERWPQWTASVRRLRREEEGSFGLGSSARMSLRGMIGASTWRVTFHEQGRAFAWENRTLGVHSIASHVVEPDGGDAKVTLTITQAGVGAALLRPLIASISRRNVEMEADGLKRYCEGRAARSGAAP